MSPRTSRTAASGLTSSGRCPSGPSTGVRARQTAQPGLGPILGARVLGEFGDDPHRYASGKARKNYAATSPITRAPGKKKVVAARFIRNDRLTDAHGQGLHRPQRLAFRPGPTTPSAPAAPGTTLPLRKIANRLVGILHGCLKTRTLYDEATAGLNTKELAA